MSKWKKIRIGLLVLAAAISLFLPLEPNLRATVDWVDLAIISVFIPVGLLFVIGIQAVNPLSAKVWKKPNWDLNFMNFQDPIQFFHFGAYVMLVQGSVTVCRVAFGKVPFYAESVMPLVMGVGTFLGVQITMLVFRAKFKESI